MDIAKSHTVQQELRIEQSENYRMAWVRRDLKDYLVQTPLTWVGMPPTKSDYLGLHPNWP